MRNREGFTLIELMLVTIIIGVLASVAVAAYGGVREKTKVSAARAEIRNVLTAAESYRAVHGVLPSALADLVDNGFHATSATVDYCTFTRDPGPPEDLEIELAHRSSLTHLRATYPSTGVNVVEIPSAADCS